MRPARGHQQPQANTMAPGEVDEVIYSGSDDDYYESPAVRRRRCEVQGRRFLQGRPLTILSAQLRGPFDQESGWKNPWLGKSKGKEGTATDAGHVLQPSSSNQLKDSALHIPDSATKTQAAQFHESRKHWTQTISSHLPSPVSSSSYGLAISPYMDDDAWSRVQAWRIDVAAKIECGQDGAVAVATPQSGPRVNKRPASSELLRNALLKKRRPNGFDQSGGELSNTTSHCQIPSTAQSPVSNTRLFTSNAQPVRKSYGELSSFSEAALDGSVVNESNTSLVAQNNDSPQGDAVMYSCSSNSVHVDNGQHVANAISGTATTPRRLSIGRRLDLLPKPSCPERSPLRPIDMKINAILNPEVRMKDIKKSQLAPTTAGPGPPVTMPEAPEERALDFCSQADRSFQYRSKSHKVDDKAAEVEAAPSHRESSSSLEASNETPDSPTPNVTEPNKQDRLFADRTKTSRSEDTTISKDSADDMEVVDERTADTTVAGIDGPTLIPTSSMSEQQLVVRPFTSSSEKDIAAKDKGHVRQKSSDPEDTALLEFKSASKRDTPPTEPPTISSTGADISTRSAIVVTPLGTPGPHNFEPNRSQRSDENAVGGGINTPSHSKLDQRLNQVNEVTIQEQTPSQDRATSKQPPTNPSPGTVLLSPQQQSPWSKETIHFTQTVPNRRQQTSTQPSSVGKPSQSGGKGTPCGRNLAVSPVQQSPWTKENPVAAISVGRAIPPGPLSNALQHVNSTQATQSQNPWAFDERPGEAVDLDRPLPLVMSPQLLDRTGKEISPIPQTDQTPPRQKDGVTSNISAQQGPPSTPTTKQSSLPTPDLTTSIKSFRDFMSPSPERSHLQKSTPSTRNRTGMLQRRKPALSRGRKERAKRAPLRVSFAPIGENPSSSPAVEVDPDETMEGAELPTRAATSPSLVRRASTHAPPRRPASPPLLLSQSELPAEGSRFGKFFRAQARKGPQVRRPASFKPLLPSASQQTCGSPEVPAMAEAFIEADRTLREQDDHIEIDNGDGHQEEAMTMDSGDQDAEDEEMDDVTAVVQNLGDFLNSFDVDAELALARREERQRQKPQEMGMYFPSTQDQAEILGAGVWD